MIAIAGIGLMSCAIWLYVRLRPPGSGGADRRYPALLECSECGYAGERNIFVEESFPLLCPECSQRGCHAKWRCLNCDREFLPPVGQLNIRCPHCRSPKVGASPLTNANAAPAR